MTVLNFYTIDLATLFIILLITSIVFMLLKYINKNEEDQFLFHITVSLASGILVSVLYSYVTIEPDEILTTNYWD